MKDAQFKEFMTVIASSQRPMPVTVQKNIGAEFVFKVMVGICTTISAGAMIYLGTIITTTVPGIRQDISTMQTKQDYMQETINALTAFTKQPILSKDDVTVALVPFDQRIKNTETDLSREAAFSKEADARLRLLERQVEKLTDTRGP